MTASNGARSGARKAPRLEKRPAPRMARPTLTTGEVALLLDVASRTVSVWCDTGLLAHYRLPGTGRERRVRRVDLVTFCLSHGVPLPDALGALTLAPPGLAAGDAVSIASLAEAAILLGKGGVACAAIDFAWGRGDCLALARAARAAGCRARLVAVLAEDAGAGAPAEARAAGYDLALARPLGAAELALAMAGR